MDAFRTALAAAVLVGAAGVAFAQHQGHGGAPMATAAPGDPASTQDFKAADGRMMKAMAVAYTGDPDVDFRVHMIPHHQGAIDMARMALKHARSPETRTLAEAIIADQEREIGEMRAWLAKRGK